MKQILSFILIPVLFLTSCSKDEQFDNETDLVEYRKNSAVFSSNYFMMSNTIDKDLFLGGLWLVDSTKEGGELEKLRVDISNFKMKVVHNSDLSTIKFGDFTPNYQNVAAYAKLFKNDIFSANVNFSYGNFSDYNMIRTFLKNSSDADEILTLIVKDKDGERMVQRKHGYYEDQVLLDLVLGTQYDEFVAFFDKKYVESLTTEGNVPTYVSAAAYGQHSLILVESDYAVDEIKNILKKLKAGEQLDNTDKDLLELSSIVIYLRSGSKESYIKRAEGLKEIEAAWKVFKEKSDKRNKSYEFPIWYKLNSLENFGSMKYKMKFDYFEKKNIQ
ncbi:hypothetical protein K2F45_24275 [Sphingobacterium siyangense]|uniref:hypothetical protein n=1 Tax=Sphingobacterium siyangense TaxID=459529 RepID=UPI00200C42CE|nr:hypothetical protein [Sphingobacterium siyangense]UQA74864.1 hypothetical protein K2F45_24275 [Sphingobacterium siyangense]